MAVTDQIVSPFAARRAPRVEEVAAVARPAPALELPLRGMTGFEEEVVERRRGDGNTAALCNEIVARCLVAPGADHAAALERVRHLPIGERDLALIAIRKASYGDRVECEVTCPACDKKTEVDFQLSALPLSLPAAPGQIEAALPDGTRAVLRPPTAGDQEELLGAGLETESERRSFLLGRAVMRLGEREGPLGFAQARALPVAVRTAMERAIEAAIVDLDLRMSVTCLSCGHGFSSPFDVSSFFLPS